MVEPEQREARKAAAARQIAQEDADLIAFRKLHPGGRLPGNLIGAAQRQGLGVR
jgi:hypothetical protein